MNTNNEMKSMTGFSAFSSTMLITLLNENKLKPFWKKKRANLTYASLIFLYYWKTETKTHMLLDM